MWNRKASEKDVNNFFVNRLPAELDQNVLVKIPYVDIGRLAPRHVLTVVLNIHESGLYQLGTKD